MLWLKVWPWLHDKQTFSQVASLPLPGVFFLTDGLHLLQLGLGGVAEGPDVELHALIWNSYSVRGFKPPTSSKPFLNSLPFSMTWTNIRTLGQLHGAFCKHSDCRGCFVEM